MVNSRNRTRFLDRLIILILSDKFKSVIVLFNRLILFYYPLISLNFFAWIKTQIEIQTLIYSGDDTAVFEWSNKRLVYAIARADIINVT